MILLNEGSKNNKESNEYLIDERILKNSRNRKVKIPKIKPKITEVLPIEDITGNGYFELKDNQGYFEISQIESKDVYSASEGEKENDMASLSYIYQAYPHDIKIIPMNFPVNTEVQKSYYLKLISNCKVESYLPHLEDKLRELEHLESHRTNREYYLFIYADTEYDLSDRIHFLSRLFSKSNPLVYLNEDKKVKILNKLYNMNTKTDTQ